MSTTKHAEFAPVVNYLADDRLRVTLPVLVDCLSTTRAALLDAQERAYDTGLEELSEEFAEILEVIMIIMPGESARNKAAATT